MKALLDANVLYPTVLREILIGVAAAGLYTPSWSQRILDEWRHVAARLGPEGETVAGAEIALMVDAFPEAKVSDAGVRTAGFDLPDPADAHVIEAALNADADLIVTANLQDFPRRVIAPLGLRAIHPDPFLTDLWAAHPDAVTAAVVAAHAKAERLGGAMPLSNLMKRARLPRLGRALRR
ncbi:PIN domain-containing protein [Paracoccus sp. TK19116]|uniref:PIN domain-containing protein n=1 Tax=Paracoccus albicereus TaxID=2922394 RepID=A0ABT1MU05_9RHOB|nr:PIN domain-containing protein [Paracoccus albicereus]MCQ0971817.1 PIN domain-containing protein [Paracoccus albicereus]